MRQCLGSLGLSAETLEIFFLKMLRNGFALSASGTFTPFHNVAHTTLEVILAQQNIAINKRKIKHALDGFSNLPAHPDVAPAFQILRENRILIYALTNGSAENTHHLLKQSSLLDFIEHIISIDEIHHWKPRREVYLHAAKIADIPAAQLALVAAHAWDIHGASKAGLITGWVSRLEKHYVSSMNSPDIKAETLDEVCRGLLTMCRN